MIASTIAAVSQAEDPRVLIVPATVKKLTKAGWQVLVPKGLGQRAYFSDQDYADAGATVVDQAVPDAKLLVMPLAPAKDSWKDFTSDQLVLSAFGGLQYRNQDDPMAAAEFTPLALDLLPRISVAQSMDVLSSMASLAGYKAVIHAAEELGAYFPMLTTAAGTIPPSKVLVLGAGVAGLQAIATAKRLGAVVEAFDVRTAVKEEVQSLGAKFIEVEGARDEASAGGYAVEQSEEYQARQRELIHERASSAQVIITTAAIPGREAPKLIEERSIEAMQPGSVIVDLASATGGNTTLTQDGKTVEHHGVKIVGNGNFPATMPQQASTLLANNLVNFLNYCFKEGTDKVDWDNQVLAPTVRKPLATETN